MCISNYIQTTFYYFGRFLKKSEDQGSAITIGTKGVSTIINICLYNLLPWKGIDQKLGI